MKITFSLTTRLQMIIVVCALAIVALLVMLGFELGLRHAHDDEIARARAHGDGQQAAVSAPRGRP